MANQQAPASGSEQEPVPAGLGDKQDSWGCGRQRWAVPLLCHLKLESRLGRKPWRHCLIASPEPHPEALAWVGSPALQVGAPQTPPAVPAVRPSHSCIQLGSRTPFSSGGLRSPRLPLCTGHHAPDALAPCGWFHSRRLHCLLSRQALLFRPSRAFVS